ncbi:CatA-like O-acetyltransferase [Thalassotalea euphylliae]|uniref:CatA-like O-acetyltransferase n=1 Tax=Thalassotalea euphylliae TaxID=1655234 RepID=UPI0036301FA8
MIETWARKNHFNFYKNFTDPSFNICFSMEITKAYEYAKDNEMSLFLVLMFLSSQACNSVEAFKTRLDTDNRPYIVNRVEPSATVAQENGLFNFCNMVHHCRLSDFIAANSQLVDAAKAEEPLANVDNRDYQIFYSITPWLSFTGYKHAHSGSGSDIPKIVFGKVEEVDGKVTMPVSVELHHAIADAIDIAKYQESFTEYMQSLA